MNHTTCAALILAALAVSGANAMTPEQRLATAESRLASLEQQNAIAERITINGFIRYAMERSNDLKDADGDELVYRGTVDGDSWDSRRLTRAGIQFNARISDQAEAVLQLLSRAGDDFDVEAQWAYIAYDAQPNLKLRAGRLVLPFYLHSQYLNVGYAYPWIDLPTEIYGAIPIDTMEGIDATWSFNTGTINHALNLFWGSMRVEVGEGLLFEVNNQHGVNLRSSMGNVSTWLGFTSSKVSLDLSDALGGLDNYNLDDSYAHYLSAGIQYDNGSLLLMAETSELKISAPAGWFPTQPAGYVMAGYRVGKLMPHLTWAYMNARGVGKINDPLPFGIAEELFGDYADRQKSWTLGARYDVTAGLAVKAEASRYYDFGNDRVQTNGAFNGGGAPDKANPAVFRLAVDAVF
jgi:hypothetical protein